jgi:transcription termination factor NusB
MAVPVRRRTRARELALQFLYTLELRGPDALDELESFVDHHTPRASRRSTNTPSGWSRASSGAATS